MRGASLVSVSNSVCKRFSTLGVTPPFVRKNCTLSREAEITQRLTFAARLTNIAGGTGELVERDGDDIRHC
jgi:hypothetical protein